MSDALCGWTSWMDQLDRPAGRTSWTDQLDGPVLFIWSLGQFAYSKIDLSVCTLLQLPSPTKALFPLNSHWDILDQNCSINIFSILSVKRNITEKKYNQKHSWNALRKQQGPISFWLQMMCLPYLQLSVISTTVSSIILPAILLYYYITMNWYYNTLCTKHTTPDCCVVNHTAGWPQRLGVVAELLHHHIIPGYAQH